MTTRGSRTARFLLGPSLVLLALLAVGCAEDAPQDVFRVAGENARKANDLWNIVFPIAVVIFVIVEGALVFLVIKYREKPGREAAQFHGNTKLEVVLTAVPALILAGIAVPTVRTIFDLAEAQPAALQVKVIAHQFWWEYQYPELGIVTANELHMPTGEPVRIELEGALTDRVDASAEVIHSFWVPRLGGTQDIVPGRRTNLTLEADEPGTYLGQCKEYCGISHANMRLRVIAEEPQDFEAWVAQMQEEEGEDAAAAEGARLFQEGEFAGGPACSSCHAVDSTAIEQSSGLAGPNLDGFANRQTFAGAMFDNTEANLSAWLRNPPGVKPGAKMPNLQLTQEQIDALIAYLQSLE
jgi:cytochrome c oxidase subunit 2